MRYKNKKVKNIELHRDLNGVGIRYGQLFDTHECEYCNNTDVYKFKLLLKEEEWGMNDHVCICSDCVSDWGWYTDEYDFQNDVFFGDTK